jgi:hypothetical protein
MGVQVINKSGTFESKHLILFSDNMFRIEVPLFNETVIRMDKEMKKHLVNLLCAVFAALIIYGCKQATEPDPSNPVDESGTVTLRGLVSDARQMSLWLLHL